MPRRLRRRRRIRGPVRKRFVVASYLRFIVHLPKFKSLQSQTAALAAQLDAASAQNAELAARLEASEAKRRDVEKEQEDVLVLLDEVSAKRKADKCKMAAAGMEVSEDEAEDDDDEE
jgi:hypothetical protein